MKILTNLLFVIFITTFISCAKNEENAKQKSPIGNANSYAAGSSQQQQQQEVQVIERKLIKDGSITFESKDLLSTRKNIAEAIKKYHGYSSSDQEFKSPGRISNNIVIRVPADNFDNLLNEISKGVDKFDNKTIEIKDVTEEFLDVAARLKTKKELEQRYLALLKQAKNVTEILEIERQIGQLRSDIESIEGRLKFLNNQISYSTLRVTIYEETPNESGFGQKFKNGFRNGWENLVWFFVALTNIWPFVLILMLFVIILRRWRKKQNSSKN